MAERIHVDYICDKSTVNHDVTPISLSYSHTIVLNYEQ
jgi:hypothetical protein